MTNCPPLSSLRSPFSYDQKATRWTNERRTPQPESAEFLPLAQRLPGKPPKVTMARRPPLSSEDLSGRVRDVAKRTRATVTLDDDLVRTAQALMGIKDKSALLNVALTALVEREATKRLTALGGTMPDLQRIPRRRMRRK